LRRDWRIGSGENFHAEWGIFGSTGNAVTDIDRDGPPDLLLSVGSGVLVLRHDSAAPGTYLADVQLLLVDRGAPRSVVIAEVTDDDLPDLLVAKLYSIDAGSVEVWT
jgi:hypothetical protein